METITLIKALKAPQILTSFALALSLMTLASCDTLKKDFLHPDEVSQPQFDHSPYTQTFIGRSSGNTVVTEHVVFVPATVNVYWHDYRNVRHTAPNGDYYYVLECDSSGFTEQFSSEQPVIYPYSLVQVNGLDIRVEFKNIANNAPGCWTISSHPNVVASSGLY